MHTERHEPTLVPFSLVCRECDAGMDIGSQEQAAAEGWSEIDYAPELSMANYVGLCPGCRETFDHWPGDGGSK